MCSTSKLGNLGTMGGGAMEMQVPMVSAAMAKVSPDKYILIDVREAGEPTEPPAALPKNIINVRYLFIA
jgi:hypothetical protein